MSVVLISKNDSIYSVINKYKEGVVENGKQVISSKGKGDWESIQIE